MRDHLRGQEVLAYVLVRHPGDGQRVVDVAHHAAVDTRGNQGYMIIHPGKKYDCSIHKCWKASHSLGVGGVAVGAGPVSVHVHHPGDEVRGHTDHQAVGDDGQHADGLQNLRPNP